MTPEEQETAAMMAAALRNEQVRAQKQGRDADFLEGFGGAYTGLGGPIGAARAAQMAGQGGALRQLAERSQGRTFEAEQDSGKFRLTQALQARREATARQQQLGDEASRRTYQDGRDAINDANALEQARILAGQKAQERGAEDQKKKQASVVELEDRFQNIKGNLAKVRTLIEKGGTWEATGAHNDLLDQALGEIAIDDAKVKDPTGVVRESDVELAKKMLPRRGFSQKNQTALEVLDAYEKSLGARRQSAYKVRGIELPGDERASGDFDAGAPTKIANQAEYDALPSGAEYVDPNGKHKRKK